jgi:hypothetical protein
MPRLRELHEVPPKPETLNGDLGSLPPALAHLRDIKAWVLWNWKFVNGKWTKVPYTIGSTMASSTDPATWSTYEACLFCVEMYDGMGFMLRDHGLVAIDLDKCRSPDGTITDYAKGVIARLPGAYVEVTPSGTGLRVIGTGTGEKVHRKFTLNGDGAAVELYRKAERYITISCNTLGECKELPNADELIDDLLKEHDKPKEKKAKAPGKAEGAGADQDHKEEGLPEELQNLIKHGVPIGARSERFHAAVGRLKRLGWDVDAIHALLARYPGGIAQKYTDRKDRLLEEVRRCYDKCDEPSLEWVDLNKDGTPKRTYRNARAAVIALGVTCQYDEFHDRMLVGGHGIGKFAGKVTDAVIHIVRQLIIDTYSLDCGKDHITDAVATLALEHSFDPVKGYFNGLKWDGVPRLETWLATYLGADTSELNAAIGRLVLTATVRRVRKPGSKFDHILTLEGPEASMKSTAVEVLAGTENFSDQTILSQSDKEQQELVRGVLIYEIAELAGMRRSEIEKVKAFVTRTHDRARPAYGRHRIDAPRRCIFVATTNEDSYLKSQTGNRRFWPVKAGTIDIEALRRDRGQLWAEAALAENDGLPLVLPSSLWEKAKEEQEKRLEADPWDDILSDMVGQIHSREDGGQEERMSSADILKTRLDILPAQATPVHGARLKNVMRRLGWKDERVIINGKRVRGFRRMLAD